MAEQAAIAGELSPLQRFTVLLGDDVFFVPCEWGTKRPLVTYKDRPFEGTKTPAYLAVLNAGETNLAVYLGGASGGLCAIDFDTDEDLVAFLAVNPTLAPSLRSRASRGAQIWMRIAGDFPRSAKADHFEWRANGNLSTIFGRHEKGMDYRFIVEAPPVTLAFAEIIWPKGWELPWADDAEANAAQTVHHAADAEELLQVALEAVQRGMRNVPTGQRKLDAGLDEIVADGNLAAEGISAARGHELLRIVGIALDEHGDVESGELERVGHALFVAEVRQADEHAVDFIRVLLEQLGALAGVAVRLHAAELGIGFGELDGLDAIFGEEFGNVSARFGDERIGKEIAVAVDDAEDGRGGQFVTFHSFHSVTQKIR